MGVNQITERECPAANDSLSYAAGYHFSGPAVRPDNGNYLDNRDLEVICCQVSVPVFNLSFGEKFVFRDYQEFDRRDT